MTYSAETCFGIAVTQVHYMPVQELPHISLAGLLYTSTLVKTLIIASNKTDHRSANMCHSNCGCIQVTAGSIKACYQTPYNHTSLVSGAAGDAITVVVECCCIVVQDLGRTEKCTHFGVHNQLSWLPRILVKLSTCIRWQFKSYFAQKTVPIQRQQPL